MLTLSSSVTQISHIGRSVEKQLKHLGILTVQDLLFYFPARYDDLSKVTPIRDVRVGERAVVRGRIELLESTRSKWRRKLLTQAMVADATGSVRVVWFNQPWIAKMFKPGDELYLVGELKDEGAGVYFSSPMYERVSRKAAVHVARIVPVYPSTEKLSQKQIRFLVQRVLPLVRGVPESLPEEVRVRYRLVSLPQALTSVHFPPDDARLEAARRRLKFDELLRIQLFATTLKRELKKVPAPVVTFQEESTKRFVASLPFQLTEAQRKAAWEILGDLTGRVHSSQSTVHSVHPMNRLLEGDVGSGKTVVVAIAALNVVLGAVAPSPQPSPAGRGGLNTSPLPQGEGQGEGRGQVAIMAPTEILARQHLGTFSRLLAPHGVCVGLLTQGAILVSESGIMNHELGKKEMLKRVRYGGIDIVIGTHALIQKDAHFKNLVLAVVDEQHRFGVEQRAALKEKREDGLMPHLLSLTATPIPRSLALVFYGDLDISILNEMPKGRQRIETVLVTEKSLALSDATKLSFDRVQAYDFVRSEVAKGHQVFWTCPIIDPSDTLGVKAATEVFEHLRDEIFQDLRVGLLHGRMRPKQRGKVMEEFAGISGGKASGAPEALPHRIDILVATPVIEVGIDVPNATVMVIEGAQRFGLAQLHQFRGRVGRGEVKSYCLLMVDGLDESLALSGLTKLSFERLHAFLECNDGFALAERDLELRGPGEVYGTAQSGFPEFKIATFHDVDIAKQAKEAAQWLLAQDPELSRYPQLKDAVLDTKNAPHLE